MNLAKRKVRAVTIGLALLASIVFLLSPVKSKDKAVKVPVDTYPKPIQLKEHNLNSHTRQAVSDLIHNVPQRDWPYTVYLSFYAVEEAQLELHQIVLCWWVHQLSFERARTKPIFVEGTDGWLARIDVRNYRWNRAAWQTVSARDPFCQETWTDNQASQFLRQLTDYKVSKKQADKEQFPIFGIVRADWFIRETMETNRSASYYDLLFARQRYLQKGVKKQAVKKQPQKFRIVKKTIYHPGGRYVYPDDSGRVVKYADPGTYEVELKFKIKQLVEEPSFGKEEKFEFIDFPRNEADWQKAFGIDKVTEFLREQKINLKFGAIVPGGDDDVNGSIVARNNRVIEIIEGPLGWTGTTYDVLKTAGNKDYLENADGVALGKIENDGGELLAQLPNGGQAGILVNGKRERIEIAATTIAHAANMDKRYPDVRTMFSCVNCHGQDSSFIEPRNLVEEFRKAGLKRKFKKREEELAYKAFFFGWNRKVTGFREDYADLITYCTTTKTNPKGLLPAALVAAFIKVRDEYDKPLTPEKCAREMGMPLDLAKFVWSKSPKRRLNGLIQGLNMPRNAWDADAFRESMLLAEVLKSKQPAKFIKP